MADVKILNLDEILAAEPARSIVWDGQTYALAGVTGETYLKFLAQRKQLSDAEKRGDEADQWQRNLDLIALLVPGLAAKRKDLEALRLQVLMRLVQFVLAEFSEMTGGATGQPGEAPAGQS